MKFKCEQCGTVYEGNNCCPICGSEAEAPVTQQAERKPLTGLDRESFWQEVKYSNDKPESDR